MPGVVPTILLPSSFPHPTDSDVFAFNQMYTSCLRFGISADEKREEREREKEYKEAER